MQQSKFLSLLFTLFIALAIVGCKKEETVVDPPVIKSSQKKMSALTVASIGIHDAKIVMDTANFRVHIYVDKFFDRTKITPNFTISNKATVSPASGETKDFTNPRPYTVTAEDGTTQVWTVIVANVYGEFHYFDGNGTFNSSFKDPHLTSHVSQSDNIITIQLGDGSFTTCDDYFEARIIGKNFNSPDLVADYTGNDPSKVYLSYKSPYPPLQAFGTNGENLRYNGGVMQINNVDRVNKTITIKVNMLFKDPAVTSDFPYCLVEVDALTIPYSE